jgi:hypothetical protein
MLRHTVSLLVTVAISITASACATGRSNSVGARQLRAEYTAREAELQARVPSAVETLLAASGRVTKQASDFDNDLIRVEFIEAQIRAPVRSVVRIGGEIFMTRKLLSQPDENLSSPYFMAGWNRGLGPDWERELDELANQEARTLALALVAGSKPSTTVPPETSVLKLCERVLGHEVLEANMKLDR